MMSFWCLYCQFEEISLNVPVFPLYCLVSGSGQVFVLLASQKKDIFISIDIYIYLLF